MTGLKQTVDTVHRMLRGEIDPDEASRLLKAPRERLAVYADFVRRHVKTALEKNYTALPPLLGPKTWNALADDYFMENPPTSYELNAAAEGFRGFLEKRASAYGLTGFHRALAELEWREWVAYSS
ncbi:MAG: DUF2063 domain-containing protein, partial [Deltaproteobacteria bacterium]|nr:DUF2063 domain-containing protein [Deltaproteobacteria bacterium]